MENTFSSIENNSINPNTLNGAQGMIEVPELLYASEVTFEEQGLKLKFTPSKRRKVKKINVTADGIMTIKNIQLASEKLVPLATVYDNVEIFLEESLQIDLSAIQLFHILKQTNNDSKKINIDADLSKENRTLMSQSGFLAIITKPKLMD